MINIIVLLLILWFIPSMAHTLDSAIEAAQETAKDTQTNPIQAIYTFQPKQAFADFSTNPKQADYFKQGSASINGLKQIVQTEATKKDVVEILNNSMNQHPKIIVTPNEEGIKKSSFIEDNAESIVKGLSNQFIDCQSLRTCQVNYVSATCLEGGGFGQQRCTKDLIVDVKPAVNQQHIYFIDIQTPGQGLLHKEANVTIDLQHFAALSPTNSATQISITPSFVIPPCQGLSVTLLGSESANPSPVKVKVLALPSCNNHFQLTVHLESADWRVRTLRARLQLKFVSQQAQKITEQWIDNCSGMEARGCSLLKPAVCTQPQATRIINGVPIMRECWQQTSFYDCGQMVETDKTCSSLRSRSCEQVGSSCLQKDTSGLCKLYQQNFTCPVNTCQGAYGVVCNGQTYCLEGNCVKGKSHPSQDFEQSVSALSAVQEAGTHFSSDTVSLFTGHAESCRYDPLDFNNCCRDKGWGQDLHLTHCSQTEQQLGLHKEAGLSVSVGEYCAKRVLSTCVSRRKMYCSFPSKLARIVQEQGRLTQLKIDFGNGKHPNCRGITPDELQHIDFNKINFQPYYEELKNKVHLPLQEQTTAQVQNKAQQLYQEKQMP
jgi:conjugal transfer mating pair stabilization protein TraN